MGGKVERGWGKTVEKCGLGGDSEGTRWGLGVDWVLTGRGLGVTWRGLSGDSAGTRRRLGGDSEGTWTALGGDSAVTWRGIRGGSAVTWQRLGGEREVTGQIRPIFLCVGVDLHGIYIVSGARKGGPPSLNCCQFLFLLLVHLLQDVLSAAEAQVSC